MGDDTRIDAGAGKPASPSTADLMVLQRFADVVAHELRTPMAIVKLAAETMRRHLDDVDRGELEESVEVIVRNTRLAVRLLDRLALARSVEEDTVPLFREPVDVGRLVRDSVDDLQGLLLQGHPTEVLGEDELVVVADPATVREVVFNLLANASRYSGAHEPIEVTVERVDGDVRVVVRDHGPGILPSQAERIFGEYVQGDSRNPGVGLGLFIARGLARAHGGELTVRPCGDDGAAFELTLPVDDPSSHRDAARRRA